MVLLPRPRSPTQQQVEGESSRISDVPIVLLPKRKRLRRGIGVRRRQKGAKLLAKTVEERREERSSESSESTQSDSTMGSDSKDKEFAEFKVNDTADDSDEDFVLSDSDSEDKDDTPATSVNADAAATADAASMANTTEKSAEKKTKLRQLIVLTFEIMLGAPPPEQWNGVGGTFLQVRKMLGLSKKKKIVTRAITTAWARFSRKESYDGRICQKVGQQIIIKKGSKEEHIIADCKEDDMSDMDVMLAINEYREINGKECVGLNAISGTVIQMKPKQSTIGKRCDGSLDVGCNWARVRFGFVKQILICKGTITKVHLKHRFYLDW